MESSIYNCLYLAFPFSKLSHTVLFLPKFLSLTESVNLESKEKFLLLYIILDDICQQSNTRLAICFAFT